MYAKIMNVAKSMFSWVIVSRECDGSNMDTTNGGQDMVSTDGLNDGGSTMVSNGGSMDSNGGSGVYGFKWGFRGSSIYK